MDTNQTTKPPELQVLGVEVISFPAQTAVSVPIQERRAFDGPPNKATDWSKTPKSLRAVPEVGLSWFNSVGFRIGNTHYFVPKDGSGQVDLTLTDLHPMGRTAIAAYDDGVFSKTQKIPTSLSGTWNSTIAHSLRLKDKYDCIAHPKTPPQTADEARRLVLNKRTTQKGIVIEIGGVKNHHEKSPSFCTDIKVKGSFKINDEIKVTVDNRRAVIKCAVNKKETPENKNRNNQAASQILRALDQAKLNRRDVEISVVVYHNEPYDDVVASPSPVLPAANSNFVGSAKKLMDEFDEEDDSFYNKKKKAKKN